MSDSAAGLVLTGPTATGKTDLSLEIARRLDVEIISMDSRQVYRGLDVGTAKPAPEVRAAVPHHGIDVVPPSERYSAGRFATDARGWIDQIRARGKVPLLVGGTGFFLRALTHPLFEEPAMAPQRREALKRWLARQPVAELARWLAVLDPAAAHALGTHGGRQRVARALEVALLSGRPVSWWQRHSAAAVAPLGFSIVVLDLPRGELYERINRRVLEMVELGLVDEVRALLAAGARASDPGMNATGYPEFIRYLSGATTLEQAIDETQRATRRYARRQLTWLRHQLPPGALWLDATRPAPELAERIARMWREAAL